MARARSRLQKLIAAGMIAVAVGYRRGSNRGRLVTWIARFAKRATVGPVAGIDHGAAGMAQNIAAEARLCIARQGHPVSQRRCLAIGYLNTVQSHSAC